MRRQHPGAATSDPRLQHAQETLAHICDAYLEKYQFEDDSILLDVTCSPGKHINAFFALARENKFHAQAKIAQCAQAQEEEAQAKNETSARARTNQREPHRFFLFQMFPQHMSWIPAYMHIDTTILKQHILFDRTRGAINVERSWSSVVDLNCSIFKAKKEGQYMF